jgi:dipeptidyl aminopeptidase/acylaminoacyl peptidase
VKLYKNNAIEPFFIPGSSKAFRFKAVVNFYGPVELLLFSGNNDPASPQSILLGATLIDRPDLVKAASPVTYVNKNDPPFLIIYGEKDNMVSKKNSILLSSWLRLARIQNELIIVKDAPHFGVMFDVDEIRKKGIAFLKKELK